MSRRFAAIAALLALVAGRFAQDVLHCSCGSRHTVTAFVVDATRARSVLTALGLAAGA